MAFRQEVSTRSCEVKMPTKAAEFSERTKHRQYSQSTVNITTIIWHTTYYTYCCCRYRPLMVLVQRLTLLSANLVDGEILSLENDPNHHHHQNGRLAPPSKSVLTPMRREYAVM